jgi:tRNA threonylcarbamoyladenosine biosynthesis protein TsaE
MNMAKELARETLKSPICLFGEIGAGKTTFTKGFLEEILGDYKEVKSPTYTYIRRYEGEKTIYHLDLYRSNAEDQLIIEELKELLDIEDAIIIIEWAENIENYLPKDRTNIHFKYIDSNKRSIEIK